MVDLGINIYIYRISHEADHALREFWEYVVFASEVIIFILGGIIAGIRVFKEDS